MRKSSESAVIAAWRKNVQPWIQAVRQREIESRALVTDAAIVQVVLDAKPARLLDIGCGEGWLARALADHGIEVTGVDAIPEFIEAAAKAGKGRFLALSYDALPGPLAEETFDAIVCNFSLFGDESATQVFHAASRLLRPHGAFIVQTLHPGIGNPAEPRAEGWREGSWAGFRGAFRDPAPWYFRSIANWERLFAESGFASLDTLEPRHPQTGVPASIIFVGRIGNR